MPSNSRRRSPRVVAPAVLTATALAVWVGGTTIAGAAEAPGLPTTLAAGPAATAALAANLAHHDSAADHTWTEANVAAVTLNGTGATTTSPNVTVSGSTVTVTAAGTYRFSGTLTNGQIVVNSAAGGLVQIILNGVTITNNTSSAISVVAAGEAVVILQDGSTNRLVDATTYQYPSGVDEPNAALWSDANLTIFGNGTLNVTGNAYDGIASKDGLVIASGNITVTAKDDAVRGNNYVVVNGGSVTATAGGDGIKSDSEAAANAGYVSITAGTVNSTSTGDAVTGFTDVIVTGGTTTAKSGGGSGVTPGENSAKGFKAGTLLVISDGVNTIDASDDGVHSNANLTIEGGTTTIATADDGVHADAEVRITGGTSTVTKSLEGVESLKVIVSGGSISATTATDDAINATDPNGEGNASGAQIQVTGGTVYADAGTDGLDSNGSIAISGGTVVVAGSATRGGGEGGLDASGGLTLSGGNVLASGVSASTGSLPSSGQGWVRYTFAANQPAGTIVHLATTSGTQIATWQSKKAFKQVLFSSSQVTRGTSYAIYTGGSTSGTAVGFGYYTGGTLSGTQAGTATAGS